MKVKLEDVCICGASNIMQKDIVDKNGKYPIYGASGQIGNVDFYHRERPCVAIVKDGAGVGRAMLLPEKSSVIGTLQYLIPNENVLPDYLYYVVKYMHLGKYYTGATIPHIYFRDYGKEEFALVPLKNQEEIVNVLNQISLILSQKKDMIAECDTLIKSRFVEMFDLEKCERGTFGEDTDFVDYRGKTPKLSDDGTIRMVNAKSVGKGFFKLVEEYVTEETYNEWMHRGYGYPGDVLFVTEGHTFGNTCQVPNHLKKFALGQRVITIKGHEGVIDNSFLCAYMQTDKFYRDINVYRTGGTAQGIRSKDLAKVSISLPDYELQKQFAAFVTQVDKLKTEVQKIMDETQLLFDSQMQKYFG